MKDSENEVKVALKTVQNVMQEGDEKGFADLPIE